MLYPETDNGYIIDRRNVVSRIIGISEPLILIRGMPGTGKSVLLSQTGSQLGCRHILRLNITDREPEIFVADLMTVLTGETGGEGNYLRMLDKALSLLRTFKYLLVDNAELLDGSASGQIFKTLLGSAGTDFKIIAASAGIPDYFADYVISGKCRTFDSGTAPFTLSETVAAVSKRLSSRFEEKEISLFAENVCQITGGWQEGVSALICAVSRHNLDIRCDIDAVVRRSALEGYVSDRLMRNMTPELADFYITASVLPEIEHDVCKAVLPQYDVSHLMRAAYEKDLFTDSGARGYTVPKILKKLLAGLLDEQKESELSAKICEYYMKNGKSGMAARTVEITSDFASACDVVFRCGGKLLADGNISDFGICASVIESGKGTPNHTVLGLLAQYYYCTGSFAKAEHLLNTADSMFGKENIYSAYRGLYKGLTKFSSEPAEYIKMINNALFYLREHNAPLPYLNEKDKKTLETVMRISGAEPSAPEPPLTVKEFGNFTVIVNSDGHELPWRTRKGCELFAYLVSLRGASVDRNRLLDILWQDDMPNNAVAMLHNMIYNIRKELSDYGLENIIRYSGRKYSIDSDLMKIDTDAVDAVCVAVGGKDSRKLIDNSGVFREYWGKYLENIDNVWANEKKEYYDRIFIKAAVMMASQLDVGGDYEGALKYYKNALKADTFNEEIMAEILKLYAKLGRADKVRSYYLKYEQMLDRELGIKPGTVLAEAYRSGLKK